MADNKFIGTYDNETEVLRKIEELKTKGAKEEDVFIASRNKGEVSMVKGRTDVDSKVAGGSKVENFLGFLTGNEPLKKAFAEMGMDQKEAERYFREVENGKIVLIADQDFGSSYINKGFNSNAAYGDPKNQTGYAASPEAVSMDNNQTNDESISRDENSTEAYLSTGPSSEEGLVPNDGLTDTASTGRNRRGVPMMDRKVDDVPANDPNVPDVGAPEKRTEEVRQVDTHTIDIGGQENAVSGMPTADPNTTDVPSAEEKTADVPTANQNVDRSLDTEAPGDLSQTARDRTRQREEGNSKGYEGENRNNSSRK